MKKKKPIKVLDAEQKKIGTTYSHRAQGLVMKGRARFIDENTIILDEGIPPCPPDKTNKIIAGDRVDLQKTQSNTPVGVSRLEDKMMKELAIDNNEIVENGFGEIVETGKNVEAEEIAVVEETVDVSEDETEVCENVTEAEILDELNALAECLTTSHVITDANWAIVTGTNHILNNPGELEDGCLQDLKDTINRITINFHTPICKLMDVYNALLARIKANNESGADNSTETELFIKLKDLRKKLSDNVGARSSYEAIVNAADNVKREDPKLSLVTALYEAFSAIRTVSTTNCETINKLLDVYISMLSK